MKSFLIYLEEDELKLIKKAAKLSRKSTSKFIVDRALEMARSTILIKESELEAELYKIDPKKELGEIYKIINDDWVPRDEE